MYNGYPGDIQYHRYSYSIAFDIRCETMEAVGLLFVMH